MAKSIPTTSKMEIKLYWRNHTSSDNGAKRVWKDSWGGDQFEVLESGEFFSLKMLCRRLSIVLEQAAD